MFRPTWRPAFSFRKACARLTMFVLKAPQSPLSPERTTSSIREPAFSSRRRSSGCSSGFTRVASELRTFSIRSA
jgi:hypothetical protein